MNASMASLQYTTPKQILQSSSEEGEISSDSDSDSGQCGNFRPKKRAKTVGSTSQATGEKALSSAYVPCNRSKNANLWGSVLTQQSSDDISSSLGAIGMQHHISRGPESFDLPSLPKLPRDSSDSSESEQDTVKEEGKKLKPTNSKNKRKRKAPKRKNNVPLYKPGQPVSLNRRCELSDTDPVDKVAEEIAFRLWERKKDLIRALTEALGVAAAIDHCNKAEDIEKSGGLMIMNGKRRRTPGGTFIFLVRNNPKIDQDPINKIFALEAEKQKLLYELKKCSKSKPDVQGKSCELMESNDNIKNSGSELATTLEHKQPKSPVPMDASKQGQSSSTLVQNTLVNSDELSDGEILQPDEDAETFG